MAAVAVSARPSARPQYGCKAVKGRLAAADGCKESIKHGVPGKLGAGGLYCRGTDRSCQVTMSALPQAAKETSVLIVGTGLTGSLACYHLRALARKQTLPLRIHVADMARGPGGRMSTTRFGPDSIRANTGAQCLSAFSPEAAALLESACAPASACPADRVSAPLKRSTHFTLRADDAYAHWLPEDGTNAAVKRFLYGGEPDLVVFESRLQRMTVDATPQRALVPLFDSGGTTSADGGPSAYDVVILAMPPKDIVKFFAAIDEENAQSQADLHRRTNRGRSAPLPSGHRRIALPPNVLEQLRAPSYVGRYSLALWFDDAEFASAAARAWSDRDDSEPHPILDMVSAQPGGVLVAQSTVALWRRLNNARGGGRGPAKASIVEALEALAGGAMPRSQNTKLLNWRTSQVVSPASGGVVAAEGGRLVFTGDWCFESSFEGCNLAARAAAAAAIDAVSAPTAAVPSAARGDGDAPPEGAEIQGRACSGPCGAVLPRSECTLQQRARTSGGSKPESAAVAARIA